MKYSLRNIIFLFVLGVLLSLASSAWAGAPEQVHVGDTHNWGDMLHSLSEWGMWKLLLGGLKTTLIILVFAAIGGVVLGAALVYMDMSGRCRWFFKILDRFVSTVHDIPSVALMMFFYYVIFAGKMNGLVVSIIALAVYISGSLKKIFKSNIKHIGKGQIEAGLTLGLTKKQCYRYIVLPQAVKSMLPLVISELKLLLRITSYAGYIAQEDLIKSVYSVREHYSDTFLPLLLVSIMYLIISWLITKTMHLLYVKFFKYD